MRSWRRGCRWWGRRARDWRARRSSRGHARVRAATYSCDTHAHAAAHTHTRARAYTHARGFRGRRASGFAHKTLRGEAGRLVGTSFKLCQEPLPGVHSAIAGCAQRHDTRTCAEPAPPEYVHVRLSHGYPGAAACTRLPRRRAGGAPDILDQAGCQRSSPPSRHRRRWFHPAPGTPGGAWNVCERQRAESGVLGTGRPAVLLAHRGVMSVDTRGCALGSVFRGGRRCVLAALARGALLACTRVAWLRV
jgi:hypothetical protein